ncbi:MAG: hypothetical protein LQ342_005563 [Letrouitia transgressa]|nr:MAG: hypothetical protein LQ342_005563 [Letrouitia transgressa]
MLSFTGAIHRRSGSGSSPTVEDLTESPKEKASHRVTSKADPTKAMNEAQPVTQAFEKSTLESLRSMQHKDMHGNLITDPDRSNPTRSRLERPLDTIRSFEAAIDGSFARRPYSRAETYDGSNHQNRRSMYYQASRPQPRFGGEHGGGYYGNRMSMGRPESYIDGQGNAPNQANYGRRFGQRVNSDPALYGSHSQNLYPAHGYHQSYDTVASASGNDSHGTDPWGNSTDPSSESSSIDRIQQSSKPDPVETYGFSGFGGAPHLQGPILEEHSQDSPAYGQPGYGQSRRNGNGGLPFQGNDLPPTPPPHSSKPRTPIKLGNPPPADRTPSSSNPEKRKSWLRRRFSKSY